MAIPASRNARLYYRAARQRLEDARFLLQAQRTTATVYLAGYSVECILKALILTAIPQSQEGKVLKLFRGVRAHDYDWLWRLYAKDSGSQRPSRLVPHFVRVRTWSTDMRYSPGAVRRRDAETFLDSAGKIIEWAEGRL